MSVRVLPIALVLGLVGPASARAGRGAGPELRPVKAELSTVAGLEVEPTAACRQQILDELVEGRRRDDRCRDDRALAGRALVRRRDAFGYVEHRVVELATLRMVLGVARRCRQWPLRSPDRDVLRRTDVAAAGCKLRRYQGPLTLTFVDHRGQRSTPLPALSTDEDGRLSIRFASLDRALRALGHGELRDYDHIEIGEAAWAGRIDLEQLLRFRAEWHMAWVRRGRGLPALFAIGHPEHPDADEARTMAADALLTRQHDDVERVRQRELTARDYLDRHPWSPYRFEVERWAREHARQREGSEGEPSGTAEPGEGGRGPATGPEALGGRLRGGTSGGIGP